MTYKPFDLQLFAAPTNATVSTDLEPAISVDFTTRLAENITELQNLLGIIDPEPMAAGTLIKIYKLSQYNTPDQVGEGEVIPLTEIKRELAKTIELTLNKYRRQTTAEAVQKVGQAIAINASDEKLVSGVRKDVKKDFYAVLGTGTGTATGTTLQAALAASWGKVKKVFDDEDATPIYFVSSDDVASYLGTAQVTMQTAFGFNYIENFLGLGTTVVSPSLPSGVVIATARENLRCAYVPASGGDLAQVFSLTADTTGLVGMTHQVSPDNASIDTLIFSGVKFYPELLDGVILSTITGNPDGLDNLVVTSIAGTNVGDTKITVSPTLTAGNSYKYQIADNATLPALDQNVRLWSVWDGTSDITAATGKEICIVECDSNYLAKKGGVAVVTAKA